MYEQNLLTSFYRETKIVAYLNDSSFSINAFSILTSQGRKLYFCNFLKIVSLIRRSSCYCYNRQHLSYHLCKLISISKIKKTIHQIICETEYLSFLLILRYANFFSKYSYLISMQSISVGIEFK